MRASPTPSAGSRHQRNAAAGLARFSIIAGAGPGTVPRSTSRPRSRQGPRRRRSPRRPRRRTPSPSCPSCRTCVRGPGSDDRRQAELAADDGRVARASAVIGDDAGGPLHDRHPVGVGNLGHQHCAIDEAVDIRGRSRSGSTGPATIASPTLQAGQERACRLELDPVGLQHGARRVARLHRLGPRLHDEELAGLAVLAPIPCPSGRP